MNVLQAMIYPPNRGGSGAPIYTHNLMRGLIQHGVGADIMYTTYREYQVVNDLYGQIPLECDQPAIFDSQPKILNSIRFRDMNQSQIDSMIRALQTGLKKALETGAYDLVHVQHGMYFGYCCALLKRAVRVPYVVSSHIMETNFLSEIHNPFPLLRGMSEASYIVALTERNRRRLLEAYALDNVERIYHENSYTAGETILSQPRLREIDPDRVVVIPPGIDIEHFSLALRRMPPDLQDYAHYARVVLYVARVIEMKGVLDLIAAEPEYNDGQTLTVIVGDGELAERVRSLVASRPDIIYLGYREQESLPAYYCFARERGGVFCVPSRSEGFSFAYLEALLSGLTVVASCDDDMGQVDCMRTPYVSFTPYHEPALLATAIQEMQGRVYDPERVRATALPYNSERFVSDMISLYNRVLGHHGDT